MLAIYFFANIIQFIVYKIIKFLIVQAYRNTSADILAIKPVH